jgi:hypothetical protein
MGGKRNVVKLSVVLIGKNLGLGLSEQEREGRHPMADKQRRFKTNPIMKRPNAEYQNSDLDALAWNTAYFLKHVLIELCKFINCHFQQSGFGVRLTQKTDTGADRKRTLDNYRLTPVGSCSLRY